MYETSDKMSKLTIFLLASQWVIGSSYPFYGAGGAFPFTSSGRQSSYLQIPANSRRPDYSASDYDDGYFPSGRADFDYYDKYDPYMKYTAGSFIPFYRPKEYYIQKLPRKYWGKPRNYDYSALDVLEGELGGEYNDDTWYDDPANAETNRAFLNNLILAQLFNEKITPPQGYKYNINNDVSNGRTYEYGIPTTKLAEREKIRKYFDEEIPDDMQDLESLTEKQVKNDEIKDKETTDKSKNMNEDFEGRMSAKTKAKLSDAEEYFNLQKQLVLNSRKSKGGPVAEGLKLEKKQVYDPMSDTSNFFDFEPFSDEPTTNSIKKLNMINEKNMNDIPHTSTTVGSTSTTAAPQNLAKFGQKEVVLPRPSSPARKPYPEISTRSMNPPSVYDTIKKLLDMEKEADNKAKVQPQKRFANTDDPLTAELKELKKPSA